jgi:hypothetical protein
VAFVNDPVFTQGVVNFAGKATAAKTALEDNTNAILLYTAPTNGALITSTKARALGTNTASVLYLFTSADAGTTLRMKAAKNAAAQTISTTAAPDATDFGFTDEAPLKLSGGERLYGAASVALAAGWIFEGAAEPF